MPKKIDNSENNLICDFCKSQGSETNNIIKGEEHSICKSCAETALYFLFLQDQEKYLGMNIAKETLSELDKDTKDFKNKQEKTSNLTPKHFKNILDEFVIGQDEAKKVLSVAIYNHLQRIKNPNLKINKSNTLLIGNTGTGKTYLAETISKNLDIPLAIVNTTSLTAAGYVGEDVSSVIERLWRNAGEDVQKAEKGIIFLDEIDKNRTSGGGTNNKDVSGKAIQQELLKILEGDIVKIFPEGSSKNHKSGAPIEINTTNILFIAGGAFVGLKDKPGVQMNGLGSNKKDNEFSNIRMQEMLDNYGIIPEFYGRFANIVELNDLDIKSMETIMTKPKDNIVQQYKNLFSLSNVDLSFSEKFIDTVANEALEVKTGARGLSTIMEDKLNEVMFNIEDYKGCNITLDYKYNKVKVLKN